MIVLKSVENRELIDRLKKTIDSDTKVRPILQNARNF